MKRLNRKEFLAFKNANTNLKVREDLEKQTGLSGIFYELVNGNILLEFYGEKKGVIYESENDLLEWVADIMSQGPKHILSGYFFDNENVLGFINQSKESLSIIFNVEAAILDFSYKSLEQMDVSFKAIKPSKKTFFETIFQNLVLYIGATLINETAGKWLLKYNRECNIYEPFIEFPNGRVVANFSHIYEFAYEAYKKFSIKEAAELCLATIS